MEVETSHNGLHSESSHHHKSHKEHKHKKKYVLGPDGKPKIGPDGRPIKIKSKHRIKEEVNHAGDGIKREKPDMPSPKAEKRRSDGEAIEKLKKKIKKEKHGEKRKHEVEQDVKQKKKKISKQEIKQEMESPTKGKKVKKEEPEDKWKWWEEKDNAKDSGVKWKFLEHKGPVFAPPYEPLPKTVQFKYDGKPMKLSLEAEEVMTFYAKMLDHEYTSKNDFNKNFFGDWRKVMTKEEKSIISDLGKCNFRDVCTYFQQKTEERKARSKAEK
uniref:DNA topoisomerase I DNA binding eukaryotic-type domain-containing protein n=1 Tax=Ciona savignyi TaxID=51511 RepID=H2Y8H3_CIOSA